MEVTVFEYPGCPYCRQARQLLSELAEENPAYGAVHFHRIDETEQQALASQYDYYRAPSFFLGRRKLYEADPSWSEQEARRRLRSMLDALTAEGETAAENDPPRGTAPDEQI